MSLLLFPDRLAFFRKGPDAFLEIRRRSSLLGVETKPASLLPVGVSRQPFGSGLDLPFDQLKSAVNIFFFNHPISSSSSCKQNWWPLVKHVQQPSQ